MKKGLFLALMLSASSAFGQTELLKDGGFEQLSGNFTVNNQAYVGRVARGTGQFGGPISCGD